jgi:threonine/homoserine/homoserine lactone efflux protein
MRLVLILVAIGVLGWAPAPVVAVLSWLVIGYLLWAAWPRICQDWQRLGRVGRRRSSAVRSGRYSADRIQGL